MAMIIVAYDVVDDNRRRRIRLILEDYGTAVNRSVFECDLSEQQVHEMSRQIKMLIDKREDSVLIYPICRRCFAKKLNNISLQRQKPKGPLVIG